jgi:hypothetical protein
MAGKGSRQRTYGKQFEDNYDRIFGRSQAPSMGAEWVDPEGNQYPQEAREGAQKGAERPTEDVES